MPRLSAAAACLLLAGPAAAAPPADMYGDPLPAGAVARFGTTRLRATSGLFPSADGKRLLAVSGRTVRVYDAKTLAHLATEYLPDSIAVAVAQAEATHGWASLLGGGRLVVVSTPGDGAANRGSYTVRVFDRPTGRLLRTIENESYSYGIPTPDGKWLVAVIHSSAGAFQPITTMRLVCWNLATGEQQEVVGRADGRWINWSLSGDGRWLLYACDRSGEVVGYDMTAGRVGWRAATPFESAQPHVSVDSAVALVAPDRSGPGNDGIFIDVRTGDRIDGLHPPPGYSSNFGLPDGHQTRMSTYPILGPGGRTIYLSVVTDRPLFQGVGPPPPPDQVSHVRVWDAVAGKLAAVHRCRGSFLPSFLSADGRRLCGLTMTGWYWRGPITVIDAATGGRIGPDPGDRVHNGPVTAVGFPAGGRAVLSHAAGEKVRGWSIGTGEPTTGWDRELFGRPATDHRRAWLSDKPGRAVAADLATGKPVREFAVKLSSPTDVHQPAVVRLEVVPPAPPAAAPPDEVEFDPADLPRVPVARTLAALAVGYRMLADVTAALFVRTDPPTAPAPIPLRVVSESRAVHLADANGQVAETPDGREVVYYDPAAFTFVGLDPATGRELWRAAVTADAVRLAARRDGASLSPDGRTLSTTAGPIDTRSGRLRATWERSPGVVVRTPPFVSPDGRLASGFAAGDPGPTALVVWDTLTGAAVANTKRAGDRAMPLAFTPDSKRLLVGSAGGLLVFDPAADDLRVAHPAAGTCGGAVTCVAAEPDGQHAVTGHSDGTLYRWPLAPVVAAPTPGSLDAAFADLGRADGFRAVWAMSRHPAAVEFLAARLKPTPRPTDDTISGLVRDLDAPRFADRERATAALRALGRDAEPAVRQAAVSGSPEAQERAERVLATNAPPAPPDADALRAVRAVAVLEAIGTPAARELLTKLAAGGSSPVTTAAGDAVARLGGTK